MMLKRVLTFILIMLTLPATSSVALAQEVVRKSSTNSWDDVKAIYTDTKLEVSLKSGETLKGRLVDVSETSLALSQQGRRTEIARDSVSRIYGEGKRSFKRNALLGAAIGGGTGLGLGFGFFTHEDFHRGTIPALGVLGAGIGAGIGAVLGFRRSRPVLIYEAR
jgi:hypothetical protein